MSKKQVLYIEDDNSQRRALHNALLMRGFAAESAGTVAEAQQRLQENGENFDVIVLDMNLEKDPNSEGMNGGKFLILTAYSEIDYYESALQIGAAAYLSKGRGNSNEEQERVIRYVRALALKRALEQPNIQGKLADIIEASLTQFDALAGFCRAVLAPEFKDCLGAPFFLLLTDTSRGDKAFSINAGGDAQVAESTPFYETLQALAHGDTDSSEPFVFNQDKSPIATESATKELFAALHGAAFLPLTIPNNTFRLSLGILSGGRDRENPKELARILGNHFKPSALGCILSIFALWAEKESQYKEEVAVTANLVLSISQEIDSLLNEVVESGDFQRLQNKLKNLADYLRNNGQTVAFLKPDSHNVTVIDSVSALIDAVWDDLQAEIVVEGIRFQLEGNCSVQVDEDTLMKVISSLLRWMMHRQNESAESTERVIKVRCIQSAEVAEIHIQDESRRLLKQLRQHLFEPFSVANPSVEIGQNLSMDFSVTKMLVRASHGVLIDRSDDISGGVGHRFVVRFPTLSQISRQQVVAGE